MENSDQREAWPPANVPAEGALLEIFARQNPMSQEEGQFIVFRDGKLQHFSRIETGEQRSQGMF